MNFWVVRRQLCSPGASKVDTFVSPSPPSASSISEDPSALKYVSQSGQSSPVGKQNITCWKPPAKIGGTMVEHDQWWYNTFEQYSQNMSEQLLARPSLFLQSWYLEIIPGRICMICHILKISWRYQDIWWSTNQIYPVMCATCAASCSRCFRLGRNRLWYVSSHLWGDLIHGRHGMRLADTAPHVWSRRSETSYTGDLSPLKKKLQVVACSRML